MRSLKISFCGGCNPCVDREALAAALVRRYDAESAARPGPLSAGVVINGCPAACGSPPPGIPQGRCLVVAGPLFEGRAWRERDELIATLIRHVSEGSDWQR